MQLPNDPFWPIPEDRSVSAVKRRADIPPTPRKLGRSVRALSAPSAQQAVAPIMRPH